MKETKLLKRTGLYKAPQLTVVNVSARRCIATSVSGSTEGFSGNSQTEGFNEIGQGDF